MPFKFYLKTVSCHDTNLGDTVRVSEQREPQDHGAALVLIHFNSLSWPLGAGWGLLGAMPGLVGLHSLAPMPANSRISSAV